MVKGKQKEKAQEQLRPVEFSLKTRSGRNVYVVGSFNKWDYLIHPLEEEGKTGRYSIVIDLPTGRHEYKFVVDDEWVADPHNRATASDGFGGLNSVITV